MLRKILTLVKQLRCSSLVATYREINTLKILRTRAIFTSENLTAVHGHLETTFVENLTTMNNHLVISENHARGVS